MAKKPAAKAKRAVKTALKKKPTAAKAKKKSKPAQAPKSEDLAAGLFVIAKDDLVLDSDRDFTVIGATCDARNIFLLYSSTEDAQKVLDQLRQEATRPEALAPEVMVQPAKKFFATHHRITGGVDSGFKVERELWRKDLACTLAEAKKLHRTKLAGRVWEEQKSFRDCEKERTANRKSDLKEIKLSEDLLKAFDKFAKGAR